MLYLANASNALVREAMLAGEIGQITTPRERRSPLPGVPWGADNGCFGKGYPGDEKYLAWLQKHRARRKECLFATAPDVVGDARATWERSKDMLARITDLGYPATLVLQDGQEDVPVPWNDIDAVFVGGSTEFKLGPIAAELVREAKHRGLYVHVGRVNSYKRLSISRALGADSADGTFVNRAPHHNLDRMRVWFDKLRAEDVDQVYPIDRSQAVRNSGQRGAGTPGTGIGEDGDPVAALGASKATPAVAWVKGKRAQNVDDYETWSNVDTSPTVTVADFDTGPARATAIVSDAETHNPETGCSCCPVDNKPDSARYRACGNAVTVPVITWIGHRLMDAHQSLSEPISDHCEAHDIYLPRNMPCPRCAA